jgi:hypothetical protein
MKFRNQVTQSISALLIALVIPALLIACGNSEAAEESTYVRIDSIATSLAVTDFENVGFKVVKEYDIEGLSGAIGALHGFQKDNGIDPLSYELRFYESHTDAVDLGELLAQEITGEDAVTDSSEMSWTGGKNEQRERATDHGGYAPFYWDYAIYGNVVILCEGDWPEQSQEACERIKESLAATISG